MDPISMAVLAALAGGVGGEVGRQAWAGLTGLVRRRHHDGESDRADSTQNPPVQPGEAELDALAQSPDDRSRAAQLERALQARAEADTDFRRALVIWAAQLRGGLEADRQAAAELATAVQVFAPDGQASSTGDTITFSGTFHAPVMGKGNNQINL
jgi:hypothetical protein